MKHRSLNFEVRGETEDTITLRLGVTKDHHLSSNEEDIIEVTINKEELKIVLENLLLWLMTLLMRITI